MSLASVLTGRLTRARLDYEAGQIHLHAAALTAPGTTDASATAPAVMLLGESGSGKSTLAAHLVSNGWGYLTDEMVGIDPRGRGRGGDGRSRVMSYPKAISLKGDAVGRFAGAARFKDRVVEGDEPTTRWEIPVGLLAENPARGRADVSVVVDLTYEAGAGLKVEARSQAEMLQAMIYNSLDFRRFGENGLAVLGDLAGHCHCLRIVYDDTEPLTELLGDLVHEAVPQRSRVQLLWPDGGAGERASLAVDDSDASATSTEPAAPVFDPEAGIRRVGVMASTDDGGVCYEPVAFNVAVLDSAGVDLVSSCNGDSSSVELAQLTSDPDSTLHFFETLVGLKMLSTS